MLQEAALAANERRPLLLLLNKKDLIKPGEVAQKLKVNVQTTRVVISSNEFS